MSWLARLRRVLTTRSKSAAPRAQRGGRGAATEPLPSSLSAVDSSATQFAGYSGDAANRGITDLVVGLDFGTVCTKVVIRSPFVASERATAVEWPGGDPRGPYLLPTVLCETAGRFCLPAPKSRPRHAHRDLKVRLMDEPSSAVARARAAAYLGLALRAARQWFLDTQRGIYGRFNLRWALNLGIPSAGYDDEQVRDAFSAAARAAWRLSLLPDPPTLEAARVALNATQAKASSATGLDSSPELAAKIEVIPEIVAEVVGYARSKRRRDGLHVMLDVGGSTVDVCGFVLHAPADGDGDQYALLTAVVAPLGLRELHLRRVCAVDRAGTPLRAAVGCDPSPFDTIPVAGRSYVDEPAASLRAALDDIDKKYASECTDAIMRVLMGLRKRDPLAPNFKKGLPVFIGGGGGRFGLVGEALKGCDARLRRALVDAAGVRRLYLPALEGLSNRALRGEMAGRLDAAYGLSYDSPDVGTIVRPEDIEDPLPPPEVGRPEFVGKEHV